MLALAAALIPLPAAFVERVYWRTFYLKIQPVLTSISNLVPIALLDVAIVILLGVMVTVFIRAKRRGGWATALAVDARMAPDNDGCRSTSCFS